MEIIKTKDLTFKYKTYDKDNRQKSLFVLDKVATEIDKGEFVAILGANGSGKSTFAKLLNALHLPTEGTIWVNGINTKNEDHIWEIRQSIGMVFQNPDNQIIASTVEEEIAFGLENLGIESKEMHQRIDNALSAVGMDEYKDKIPSMLSGGQKQKIAIASILAMKPECIVMDEPTAMLDPVGRKSVMEIIATLKTQGITIILITHFMEEAIKADRVIVMEKGRIILDDIPKKVFSQMGTIKNLALDVPQVTEIAHLLNKKGVNLPTDILTIEEMVEAICQLKQNI